MYVLKATLVICYTYEIDGRERTQAAGRAPQADSTGWRKRYIKDR